MNYKYYETAAYTVTDCGHNSLEVRDNLLRETRFFQGEDADALRAEIDKAEEKYPDSDYKREEITDSLLSEYFGYDR